MSCGMTCFESVMNIFHCLVTLRVTPSGQATVSGEHLKDLT